MAKAIPLSADGLRPAAHVFEREDALAIEAALLTGRPLLLRGEPGSGKSQFARAAAAALGRAYRFKVVSARTEAHELLWTDDPVRRLGQAQLVSALSGDEAKEAHAALEEARFIRPGPLWWGFDWASACDHLTEYKIRSVSAREAAAGDKGVVVLIDEIDKAEPEVPNGLLEALGERSFSLPHLPAVSATQEPLIVVASNEDRALPPAFLRRCVVHELTLPEDPVDLVEHLVARGRAHFPKRRVAAATKTLLKAAAEMTAGDRTTARERGLRPLPGLAEYIDLLRAVFAEARDPDVSAEDALKQLRPYFLRKHSELRR